MIHYNPVSQVLFSGQLTPTSKSRSTPTSRLSASHNGSQ
ncbi:unnamed protein product, partial [Linum tenue]